MNKIIIENLIMRAVFDVLTGKNANPIYMEYQYAPSILKKK